MQVVIIVIANTLTLIVKNLAIITAKTWFFAEKKLHLLSCVTNTLFYWGFEGKILVTNTLVLIKNRVIRAFTDTRNSLSYFYASSANNWILLAAYITNTIVIEIKYKSNLATNCGSFKIWNFFFVLRFIAKTYIKFIFNVSFVASADIIVA